MHRFSYGRFSDNCVVIKRRNNVATHCSYYISGKSVFVAKIKISKVKMSNNKNIERQKRLKVVYWNRRAVIMKSLLKFYNNSKKKYPKKVFGEARIEQ